MRLLTKSCEVILLTYSSYFFLVCRTQQEVMWSHAFVTTNLFKDKISRRGRPTEEDNDQLDLLLFVLSVLFLADFS